ncbi:hypothetical protein B0H12DRAFT_225908 [Mycena haematopus]|nr:hypothetical protein B0H12DRAFT_225908 [Mycena haematopus]
MTQITAETEVADLKKSIEDMAKILASLSAEVAKRRAATALEQVLGLPANSLAFPPDASGTYPTLPTSLLHPHLHPDIVAQIGKFEFPPANLGRLLKAASPPPQPTLLLVGPNGEPQFIPATVSGASAPIRDIPDILTFVEAWSIFMSVLQNQCLALPITQALSAHLNNIISISRVYSWAHVLEYHVAFVQLRALDPFFDPMLWMRSDPYLHTLHLLTPSLLNPLPAPTSAPTPAAKPVQICFAYNSAGCGGAAVGCFRRHVCRACGGPHPVQTCRAVPAGASPSV